jgi:membrane protease YdiL (CAAX protease family)
MDRSSLPDMRNSARSKRLKPKMENNILALPLEDHHPPDAANNGVETHVPIASTLHTVILLFVILAWGIWGYFGARRMSQLPNPHRTATYLVTSVWEWAVVGFVAWGLHRRGGTLRGLIGGSWKKLSYFAKDWGISVVFWILAMVVLSLLTRLLHATQVKQNLRFLMPRTTAESAWWVVTSFTAGITEEIIFRGYLQKQFTAWTKNIPLAVLLSAVTFGAGHLYQSWKGAVIIAVYGLMFGILAQYRKSLRPGMMAHVWHDAIIGMAWRLVKR